MCEYSTPYSPRIFRHCSDHSFQTCSSARTPANVKNEQCRLSDLPLPSRNICSTAAIVADTQRMSAAEASLSPCKRRWSWNLLGATIPPEYRNDALFLYRQA